MTSEIQTGMSSDWAARYREYADYKEPTAPIDLKRARSLAEDPRENTYAKWGSLLLDLLQTENQELQGPRVARQIMDRYDLTVGQWTSIIVRMDRRDGVISCEIPPEGRHVKRIVVNLDALNKQLDAPYINDEIRETLTAFYVSGQTDIAGN